MAEQEVCFTINLHLGWLSPWLCSAGLLDNITDAQ
jgi:hypothetical protein